MKKATIGFSTYEKVISIIFMMVFMGMWLTQSVIFLTHNELAPVSKIGDSPEFMSFYVLAHLPMLCAIMLVFYVTGMSINLYDDRIEYAWLNHVIRTIPLKEAEIHVYKFFFKNYVAIYDKKNNKLYKAYSKQRVTPFIDYVKAHNLAIFHDGYRYFNGYMSTKHPSYKRSF